MDKIDKTFVKACVTLQMMQVINDLAELEEAVNALLGDVIEDIEETTGANWHSGDVEISLARVLLKRILGNE